MLFGGGGGDGLFQTLCPLLFPRLAVLSKVSSIYAVYMSVCLYIDASYLRQHCKSGKKAEDKQFEKSVSPPVATRSLPS